MISSKKESTFRVTMREFIKEDLVSQVPEQQFKTKSHSNSLLRILSELIQCSSSLDYYLLFF